jgi:hypothetical protein
MKAPSWLLCRWNVGRQALSLANSALLWSLIEHLCNRFARWHRSRAESEGLHPAFSDPIARDGVTMKHL